MKKYWILILSIIVLVLSFLKSWYSDQLLDSLFIFYIIPNLILFIVFNICLIKCINKIKSDKLCVNYISLIVLVISVLLFIFFPFREIKVKYELERFEKGRLEIIEKISNYELIPYDDLGNIELSGKYSKYSTGGDVTVYQNDSFGQVICFWIFRGIQSGSVQLMYSTGGEELIRKNETPHPITNIEKLKENWFYVETDY